MLYEINYLVLQSQSEKLGDVRKSVKETINSLGGEIREEKEFLKRKLAYEIKNESYGFHTVLRFETETPQECIEQLKKKLDLSSSVARYVIVRADDLLSLKELFSKQQEEKRESLRDTIKQEDVGKLLVENKKKEERLKKEKKEEETVKAEESPKEEKTSEKEDSENLMNPEKEEKKEEVEKKEDEKKAEKEEEKKKEKEENKVSLDDLDEKLDEILNL